MTDEKMGEALLPSVSALPKGSGVVFRHYGAANRRALFIKVQRIARRRRLLLVLAGSGKEWIGWKANGVHNRSAHKSGQLRTAPVHTIPERIAAERAGASLLFVSSVFPTSSHKDARPLGFSGFGRIVRDAKCPVIALGGMTAKRARALRPFRIYGWAAIDGLMV